jgi:hypothetical protein
MADKPHLRAIVLCDLIIRDAATSKHSLINVFEGFWASHFPIVHPNVGVFSALTDVVAGEHEFQLDFRLDEPDSMDVIGMAKGRLKVAKREPISVGLNLQPVVLPRAGNYCFEVRLDSDLIGRHSVKVGLKEPIQ